MKDFLKSAEDQLKSAEDRKAVMLELKEHLELKKEFFESIGYDTETSEEKANEAMGSGEIIGQRLSEIHRRKNKKIIGIFILCTVCVNAGALFTFPTDKNAFVFPFTGAALILINNLLDTAAAIKLKSVFFSAVLMIASATAMQISTQKLIYPVLNMVLNNCESADSIYNFLRIATTIAVNAVIFLPNLYNIYHCVQIKRLKNTKRQNRTASTIFSCCIVFSVITAALSVPSYLMNERFCEKQEIVREELVAYAFELEKKYDTGEQKELESYLKNSGYEFEKYTRDRTVSGEIIRCDTYLYHNGNWTLQIDFDERMENCVIKVEYCVMNCSQKYLFAKYDEESTVLDELGDDEFNGKNGGAIGKTREEIRESINSVAINELKITKQGDHTVYDYKWTFPAVLYGMFGYTSDTFYFDAGVCSSYDLTLD